MQKFVKSLSEVVTEKRASPSRRGRASVRVGVRESAREPISTLVCVSGFVYTAVAHSDVHAHIKDEASY